MQTFKLEQLVYLIEECNRCVKVAMGKIIERATVDNYHKVQRGGMWAMEAYHPQTQLQWPDESDSTYKLLQV